MRLVFDLLVRAYRTFGGALAFVQGLWLGSVFPERIVDLMLLAFMVPLIIEALFFGLRMEQPSPLRLASHATTLMLSVAYALMVATLMPALVSVGMWLAVVLSVAVFLPVGCCGLAALVAGLKTIKGLVASRRERTRIAF